MTATAPEPAVAAAVEDCPKCLRTREITDWVVNSMRAQAERTPEKDMAWLADRADGVEAKGPERHSEHLDTPDQ